MGVYTDNLVLYKPAIGEARSTGEPILYDNVDILDKLPFIMYGRKLVGSDQTTFAVTTSGASGKAGAVGMAYPLAFMGTSILYLGGI